MNGVVLGTVSPAEGTARPQARGRSPVGKGEEQVGNQYDGVGESRGLGDELREGVEGLTGPARGLSFTWST